MKCLFIVKIVIACLVLLDIVLSIKMKSNNNNEISMKTYSFTDNFNLLSKEKANVNKKIQSTTEEKNKNFMKNNNTVKAHTETSKILTEEEVYYYLFLN